MKLYSFYTLSHKQLKDDWFLQSMKDDFELILEEHPQECLSGEFMQAGWIDCMKRKADLIIRAIQENEGEVFIHADVDIQFFNPVKDIIKQLIKGKDMIIQKESPRGTICPGLFAAVGNQKNLKLWQDIRIELEGQTEKHDQDLLNDKLLRCTSDFMRIVAKIFTPSNCSWISNAYGLKWSYLPKSFYCPGASTEKIWEPGTELSVPEDIVLHHANWTVGVENKIAQLEYVKGIVESRNSSKA